MTWLLLAGVPSLLYAISNHIDKHLLEKHFKMQDGVTILVVVSAVVSVVALPFLYFWSPGGVLPDDLGHIPALILMGILYAGLLWFYFMALNEEDTTTVVVFYSFLPVIGLIASYFVLGETLLPKQMLAMIIIIFGIGIVSFEKNEGEGFRFKKRAALFMFCASLCWALGDVIFKMIALDENIYRTLYWEHLVLFVLGVGIYVLSKKVRSQMAYILKNNTAKIISINLANEALYIVANIVSAFPLIMVQVAAVHLVQAFQPVWVFLIALTLIFVIGTSTERFTKGQLIQKGAATIIAVFGMYLLAVST